MTMDEMVKKAAVPRRMTFEPVVTMGNILSILAMAGAVLTVYVSLQVQLATQETRLRQIEEQIDDLNKIGEAVVQIRVDIATIRALYQAQLGMVPPESTVVR